MSDESEDVLARWLAAFPPAIAGDVALALAAVPARSVAMRGGPVLTAHSTDSQRHAYGIVLDGHELAIPARMYNDLIWPADTPKTLTPVQRTVLGCMYTRHHLGHVRQRWVREIMASDEDFVVPFVVQLAGEYVVEIIADICNTLGSELEDSRSATAERYGRFLAANPGFLFLTRQRVASYWDCYHRRRYLSPEHYPGHVLLSQFSRAAQNAGRQVPGTPRKPGGSA